MRNKKRWGAVILAALLLTGNVSNLSLLKELNFQGDITTVEAAADQVQMDVPDLDEVLTEKLGDDFLVGCAITGNEISDENLMALVDKHFNAVTFGNELKPDSMFNYSNDVCPGTQEVVLNGEKLTVPVLNFDRPEAMLAHFVEWNEKHPDQQIKIRGHVLTWHSQTPEWFFHEDYDASKPYVSKEEMTKRHEWYIKSVLEHFVGEDSPYKDMFYGWDVVNEAVSDSTGTYRNASENSSWWAVYESKEFIINAFRFANKYAPESLELYYNDYNECDSKKMQGIVTLLMDVKHAEGTRISGMGMQGHYQTADYPTVASFLLAAKSYASVVDKVQVTEMDFQCTKDFDGTDATYDEENIKLAYRYKEYYDAIEQLREDGVNVGGLTVWGVIDRNSWLQSASFVGGGASGNKRQVPLLFDDYYQVKPSYWAFVDNSMLHYPTKNMSIVQTVFEENSEFFYRYGKEYSMSGKKASAKAIPVWTKEGIQVRFTVTDDKEEAEDNITVYVQDGAELKTFSVDRKDAQEISGGYEATVKIPVSAEVLKPNGVCKMDFVITNGKEQFAYNNHDLENEITQEDLANVVLHPYYESAKGTAIVDGVKDEVYQTTASIPLTIVQNAALEVVADTKDSAVAKVLWDDKKLYVYVDVKDSEVVTSGKALDSVDIMIDEKNQKAGKYQSDDKCYTITASNEHSFLGSKAKEDYIESEVKMTEDGYVVEAAIDFTALRPFHHNEIGMEIRVNNASKGGDEVLTYSWGDESGMAAESTKGFTSVFLGDEHEAIVESESVSEIPEESNVNLWNRICNFFKNLF